MTFLRWLWGYVGSLFRSIGRWCVRYPIAAVISVIVMVVAIVFIVAGKDIQIGGLLGKLFGKEPGPNARGVPPKERVRENGTTILPGESDNKGFVQSPALKTIKTPGLFDDPKTITVVHPEKGDIKIDLPEGVKNEDVKEVVEIEADVYEVRNNDSGADVSTLLDVLGDK